MLQHLAGGSGHVLDVIGFQKFPAVDGGAHGHGHLHARAGDALSEADAGEVRVPDVLLVGHLAGGLAADAHAGLVVHAEGVDVLVEFVRAHLDGHGHEGRVAAVLDRLSQRLAAVALTAPALDLLAQDVQVPLALEGGPVVHRAGVQGRRQGDHLEDGARLVGLGDHPLPGQVQQRLRVGPGRVVGIDGGVGADGVDLAGLGAHDHAVGVLGQVGPGRLLESVLQKALDARVHGELDGGAADGGDVGALAAGDLVAVPVRFGDLLAVHAGEDRVVGELHAGLAVTVHVGEAQKLAEQVPLGVVPLHVGVVADGPVLLEGDQLGDDVGFHLVLDLHLLIGLAVLGVDLGHLGDDGLIVHIEQGGKDVGDTLPIRVLRDGLGVHADLVGGVALGEDVAVSIQYPAPLRLQGQGALPLALGHLGVLGALDDGHVVEVHEER